MVSLDMTVPGPDGFHMRSAKELSDLMSTFESDVTVLHNGNALDAKSLLELMAACMRHGDSITIVATGPDERETIAVAARVVEDSRLCCTA